MTDIGGFKFTVSISGHRNIVSEDIKHVERALASQLRFIAELVGKDSMEVVSGLAEGADTLAARVALRENLNFRAVLPAPVDVYRSDFDEKSVLEFDEFINLPNVSVEEIALPLGRSGNDFVSDPDRTQIYVRLMDYLVRRSNIIIALWDGKFSGLEGGTSEVVRSYLDVVTSSDVDTIKIHQWPDNEVLTGESSVVIWIPVRRENASFQINKNISYLFSNGLSDKIYKTDRLPQSVETRCKYFRQFLQQTEQFGRFASGYSLLISKENEQKDLSTINDLYKLSDQAAVNFQNSSDKYFKIISLLGAIMGFIFLLYAGISNSIEFLIAYIVVFSFSYIFFIKIAKSESFSMHLTARNIAELMRIRFFARLSAVDSSPELNFSHLLREYNFSDFSGSHAVHDFVRCSEPLCFDTNANFEASYQSVRERWLDDQRYYFTKKEKQLSAKSRRLKLLKKLLLPASVVQAIFLILFADGLENISLLGVPAKSMVLFLMGVFPLLFAVWNVYENKMATQELLWQYRNQRIFFEDALQQLDETDASEGRKKILELLVKRSISELFQWILNRYHREHEPPS